MTTHLGIPAANWLLNYRTILCHYKDFTHLSFSPEEMLNTKVISCISGLPIEIVAEGGGVLAVWRGGRAWSGWGEGGGERARAG